VVRESNLKEEERLELFHIEKKLRGGGEGEREGGDQGIKSERIFKSTTVQSLEI
jgi:hypothetical protein